MANVDLKSLDTKFSGYATTVSGINGYVFDDLSAVNKMKKQDLPFLMLNPPNSTITDLAQLESEDYVLEFFVFDIHPVSQVNQGTSLTAKWSTLHDLGRKVLQQLNLEKPEIGIIAPIGIERGHRLHNSKYVGVKYTVTVRVFDCIPAP